MAQERKPEMKALHLEKIIIEYGRSVNFLHTWGVLPYVWCDKHRKMTFKSFAKPKLAATFILLALHQVFLYIQAVRMLSSKEAAFHARFFVIFLAYGFSLFLVNFYVVFRDPTDHPALVNNFLAVATRFYAAYGVMAPGVGKLKIVLRILRYGVFIMIPLAQVLPTLWNPAAPTFYTSLLLKKPSESRFMTRMVLGMVQLYVSSNHFCMFTYIASTVMMFFGLVPKILQCLRQTASPTGGTPRELARFKTFYVQLALTMNVLNETHRTWFCLMIFVIVPAVIFNFTISILYHHPRGIIVATLGFPLLMIFVRAAGDVHEESVATLRTWKKSSRGSGFSKCLLSLRRPLRIKCGRLFFLDRHLMLTILSIVLTETTNLIVTFRSARD